MWNPTTKNLEFQEEGFDIHLEDCGSPACMWTMYLQDQSSSNKLLVGEGSGGRKEDALVAITGPPEPGGSVQCVRAMGAAGLNLCSSPVAVIPVWVLCTILYKIWSPG